MNRDKETMDLREAKLRQMRILPLSAKIEASKRRIIEWYEHYDGDVSISFSGGWDSTALVHLVRSVYPNVPAAFANTGLEYPENVEFVKTFENVRIVKPEKQFLSVIEKYGYPCVSKRVSQFVHEVQVTKSEHLLRLRLEGIRKDGRSDAKFQMIPLRWQFLKDAPFKISDVCCDHLKKVPLSKIKNPIIGILVSESQQRELTYKMTGCNYFDGKVNRSWPIAFWTREDVTAYIRQNNLPYSKLYDMGYQRSGCMFCLFGLHMEGRPNRFDRMKITHPKIYRWCMDGPLKLREVIEYVYGIQQDMLNLNYKEDSHALQQDQVCKRQGDTGIREGE